MSNSFGQRGVCCQILQRFSGVEFIVDERTKVSDICHTPAHALRPPDNEAVDKGCCPVEEGQNLLHSSCPFILCSLELLMGPGHNTHDPAITNYFYDLE